MSEHYTEQARRALFFARYEAFELGSPFIETEHLLLALFRDEKSLTARVFERARLSLDGIRQEVKARTARHGRMSAASELPLSDDAKRVIEYASQEAARLLHERVGTEHLLLGLLREHHGLAAIILTEQGLQLAEVRDQIVAMRSVPPISHAGLSFRPHVATRDLRALRISPSRREPREGPFVVSDPHSVNADGFTLAELIAWAHRADARDVKLPDGFDDRERYEARLDLPSPQSWPAIDRAVQDGIALHFGITVARETRPVSVFVLTALAGPSPGRRRHDADTDGSATMYAGFSTIDFTGSERLSPEGPAWLDRLHSVGPIVLTATTIADFVHWLEEIVADRVIDETGLTGTYDIELQGEMQGFEELRQALAQQLALGLARSQREMSVLVVRRSPR